ncbi:flagellar basal body rod protein FlgC [Novibacillus thermophilus]|jgi:flagellar basal-body rod protein FlgC|uniref:Flagellar basal-body rod protein FlgC n=1 Tax=Novibacillus thermophilus TaxID=1471761 RepID=A0A1U9KA75_9BACL|nr:flagellar basal body rod protein FlgC [Novibacillus thermophilus]AQS56893.1 flagellar basal body rod protein FlgC [Novibacillus thermophilus]
MGLFQGLDISATGLTANRFRMDVISANIANANTTRARRVDGEWMPYQRQMVVMQPAQSSFRDVLNRKLEGVKVTRVVKDETPFKLLYQPEHPDADENGYVRLPNVDLLKEMVDMVTATRSYEANVTAFNASKQMALKALEIGR